MERTTGAMLGLSVVLLAATPAAASSMVDITGTLATGDAVGGTSMGGSTSALKSVTSAVHNLPTFTPPKIEAPEGGVAATPGAGKPSTPSVNSALGGGGWKARGSSTGATSGKTSWTTAGASRGSGGAHKAWATAGSPASHASGMSAWKTAASGTTVTRR
jgi:hypothetical protein